MHRNLLAALTGKDPQLPVGYDYLHPLQMTLEEYQEGKAQAERDRQAAMIMSDVLNA